VVLEIITHVLLLLFSIFAVVFIIRCVLRLL
jgi:hypothetical protein